MNWSRCRTRVRSISSARLGNPHHRQGLFVPGDVTVQTLQHRHRVGLVGPHVLLPLVPVLRRDDQALGSHLRQLPLQHETKTSSFVAADHTLRLGHLFGDELQQPLAVKLLRRLRCRIVQLPGGNE